MRLTGEAGWEGHQRSSSRPLPCMRGSVPSPRQRWGHSSLLRSTDSTGSLPTELGSWKVNALIFFNLVVSVLQK